jgi:hypothetical protein
MIVRALSMMLMNARDTRVVVSKKNEANATIFTMVWWTLPRKRRTTTLPIDYLGSIRAYKLVVTTAWVTSY